jgi:hypothetical protein
MFTSQPSLHTQATPSGKMNPEVTKLKNRYVSVLVLSAMDPVAMVAIITHNER